MDTRLAQFRVQENWVRYTMNTDDMKTVRRYWDLARLYVERRTDKELAREIASVLSAVAEDKADLFLRSARRRIEHDKELSAFFELVSDQGINAWKEELRRAKLQQYERAKAQDHPFTPALSWVSVYHLLGLWRSWGRRLIDSETTKAAS